MLSAFLILAFTDSAPTLPYPWAEFSRSGALNHITETVQIAIDHDGAPGLHYKLRLSSRHAGSRETVRWTSDRKCPQVVTIIDSMGSIALPQLAPPGSQQQPKAIILDGATYSLTAPSSDANGSLTITSNVGSPIAGWISKALDQLAPCWRLSHYER